MGSEMCIRDSFERLVDNGCIILQRLQGVIPERLLIRALTDANATEIIRTFTKLMGKPSLQKAFPKLELVIAADNDEPGIKAAKAAGMTVIGIASAAATTYSPQPDEWIADYTEINDRLVDWLAAEAVTKCP